MARLLLLAQQCHFPSCCEINRKDPGYLNEAEGEGNRERKDRSDDLATIVTANIYFFL